MTGEYSVHGLAVPASLDLLHGLLQQVRSDHPEIDELDLSMLETAIVEIHGNVIEHGTPPGEVVYAFELRVHDDRLVGILADTGNAVPDLSRIGDLPDELAESGRGLWLAKESLDELVYSRTGDRNTWKLVRRRSDAATPA
jgi:serine/threonine-protein kinase RsbW